MPTPYEQELLDMSRRANAVEPTAGPALPEIDPRMLLSAAAASEVDAARSLTAPSLVVQQARRAQDRIAAQQDALVMDQLRAPAELPSLDSIFMASATREIGMNPDDLANAVTAGDIDSFSIGYDTDIDYDEGVRGVPNEAVRFQVGRESPPRRPFSAQSQSTDGVVVSQRSAGGRFEPTRSYEPLGPVQPRQMTAYEARAVRPNYVPILSVDTSPAAPAPAAPAMSAIDVISGTSFDNL